VKIGLVPPIDATGKPCEIGRHGGLMVTCRLVVVVVTVSADIAGARGGVVDLTGGFMVTCRFVVDAVIVSAGFGGG